MISNTKPLENLIVLDLTRAVSGPYCTMMLSKLGATIIKIENPNGGDDTRGLGPFIDEESTYNAVYNSNKKSIALDLKKPEDKIIFEQLLPKADILVENFRPGVLARLGYSWEHLHELYPQLIYVAISGYGQTGPIADHACYDLIAQGLSGLMKLTGHPQSQPTKVGTEIADVLAGVYGAFATNVALYHRAMTGEGTLVDIAMLDCMVSLLYSAIDRYSATNQMPTAIGNRHPTAVPFDTFDAQDEAINIAVANDSLFKKFCTVLERPELAHDERFATIHARTIHREYLYELIIPILKTRKAKEWVDDFIKVGVPAGRVYDILQTLNFPQLQHRNMVARFSEGYMSDVRFPGNPIKISCMTDTQEYPPAPKLNAHREEILSFLQTGLWSE